MFSAVYLLPLSETAYKQQSVDHYIVMPSGEWNENAWKTARVIELCTLFSVLSKVDDFATFKKVEVHAKNSTF